MPAKFRDLKFSTQEVELLKSIKAVEDVAGVARSLLRSVPFLQLFASPNPVEVLVTIADNDWDLLPEAMSAIGKIKSCRLASDIELFQVTHHSDRGAHPNRAFFDELRDQYKEAC